MAKLSPMAKIMNSVPGNVSPIDATYIWMNTENNNALAELDRKELRKVHNLESNYFKDGAYHVIKVNNNNKKTLTYGELLKELELCNI